MQGWYCTRAALWANNYEQPEAVQAHAGALWLISISMPCSCGT